MNLEKIRKREIDVIYLILVENRTLLENKKKSKVVCKYSTANEIKTGCTYLNKLSYYTIPKTPVVRLTNPHYRRLSNPQGTPVGFFFNSNDSERNLDYGRQRTVWCDY